jgi:hypothetical protein
MTFKTTSRPLRANRISINQFMKKVSRNNMNSRWRT